MKCIIALVFTLCFGFSFGQIGIGSLTNKESVIGTEKIPVSGSGEPSITPNLIKTFLGNPLPQVGSSFFSGQSTYQVTPILTDGVGQANLEIINLGNWLSTAQGLESRNLVPAGMMRLFGNIIVYRNLKFNNTLDRYEQYNTAADSYGAARIELGGEGVNLLHDPAGTEPYQTPALTMAFSVRGDGPRGLETQSAVTGYVNQSMAKMFLSYHSTDNFSQLGYWMNPATDPMIWVHTKEAKGTENEMIRLEANASSATVYGGHYFQKSRGSMTTPTVVVANDIGGRMGWKYYDGNSYDLTSVIQSIPKGTIADGNVGSSIQFLTSATNTAGLTTRLEITDEGSLNLERTVTAGGTTGDQTINKMAGTVNFAPGATSLVVTNSLVTTTSSIFPVIRTNDATATIKNVVPATGSFTINLSTAATAETSVAFFVHN
jgi:hypothetical protein